MIHDGISPPTLANIFYELGWMQAYGKETLGIRVGDVTIPSDFVRTEYVPYDNEFERRFGSFLRELEERAAYYTLVSEQVERNPLLAIDYLRRAYLLTGDQTSRDAANEVFASAGFEDRAKNSVEMLLTNF